MKPMKRIFQLLLLTSLIAFSACTKKTTIVKTSMPPGQAKKMTAPGQVKKMTGSKSAAPYAPGQAKKASSPSGSTASTKSKGKGQDKKK
jgi:hypothetical protein